MICTVIEFFRTDFYKTLSLPTGSRTQTLRRDSLGRQHPPNLYPQTFNRKMFYFGPADELMIRPLSLKRIKETEAEAEKYRQRNDALVKQSSY